MGLFDKIKEAAKNAAEENALAQKQRKENLKKLTDYVHEHIKELDDIFVENEGKLYPVKASLIFGETKTKNEIDNIVFQLDTDDEGYENASLKEKILGDYETPHYIDTEIDRLFVSAGEGAVNLEPKHPISRFYIRKKERAIKSILDGIDSATNLTSAEVMEKIKYCDSQRIKEDDSRLQEAWDKCIASLIKYMPNPELSDWMNGINLCYTEFKKHSGAIVSEAWRVRVISLISSKPVPSAPEMIKEIKLCYSEIKNDLAYGISEAWEERVRHLMGVMEMPSAEDTIRTIQEYERLQKQLAADKDLSDNDKYAEEWKRKKKELIDYAKQNYMDNPSVKQYFTPWWKRLFGFGK